MESLLIDKLEIRVKKEGSHIYMKWLGRSDSRNPASYLNPYFTTLIPEIKNYSLEVDFNKLKFMNSSTVISIMLLMKLLNQDKIKTEISYDKNIHWQKTSFAALKKACEKLDYVKMKSD